MCIVQKILLGMVRISLGRTLNNRLKIGISIHHIDLRFLSYYVILLGSISHWKYLVRMEIYLNGDLLNTDMHIFTPLSLHK